MKKIGQIAFALILLLSASACTVFGAEQGFKSSEYISQTGTAKPGEETRIELSDGAAINIPAESVDGDVSIKIERSPEKAKTLPPLPEGFVQVGDFYNFEVTSGNLRGPIDLTIPFDEKSVPKEDGFLIVAIPTKDGWKIMPVESTGNKITIYIVNPGDPLIAWHLKNSPNQRVCNSTIDLGVVPNGDKFNVVGRVKQSKILFFEAYTSMADINIRIQLNGKFGQPGREFATKTAKDGSFSMTWDPKEIPEIGEVEKINSNWVFAYAECERLHGLTEIVEGFTTFQYFPNKPEQPAQPAEPGVSQAEPPVAQPIAPPKTPTEKIAIPNVVGMTLEDAQKTLENLGFNTTWIDGKSRLELGKIYSQTPVAGILSVPHRTTVVLYRTIEVVTEPPECAQFNLTPEECANLGTHKYFFKTELACKTPSGLFEKLVITFSQTSVELKKLEPIDKQWNHHYEWVDKNTYIENTTDNAGESIRITIIFNKDGFTMFSTGNDECGVYFRTFAP